jgi:ATP-dependent exoDNAse (exonuclease V) beta subunit
LRGVLEIEFAFEDECGNEGEQHSMKSDRQLELFDFGKTAQRVSPDQQTRDRFTREIHKNFSVIAAAGTGKTLAIVDRIVTIALEGEEDALPRLVVVTYTRSAANEFRRRVRAALLDRLKIEASRTILQRLDRAFFGTIHSFCVRLLRDFPQEFPADPIAPSTRTREKLWDQFISDPDVSRRFSEDPLAQKVLVFCTWQELLDLAVQISRPKKEILVPDQPPLPNAAFLANCVVPGQSRAKQARLVQELENLIKHLRADTGAYLRIPTITSQSESLIGAWQSSVGPLVEWIEDSALVVANQLAEEFRAFCLRRGIVTFDDQISLCHQLLADPNTLDQLRQRRPIVILDEAQDTTRSMFEILVEIARPVGAPFGTWPGRRGNGPEEGRFSMVGDPRQVIYERAAIEFYDALNEAFRMNGAEVRLKGTMRCPAMVVQTVNSIFKQANLAEHEIRYDDLDCGRPEMRGYVGKIQMAFLEPDPKNVEAVFDEEARQLAEWIQQQGKPGLGIESWNQVAVLAPRHDWLIVFAGQLRKLGLAFIYRNQKISWSSVQAFSWPVALLYTVAHPWDRFERFGVLREVFGVADTELVDSLRTPPRLSNEYTESEALLTSLQLESSDSMSLGRFVDRVFQQCQLFERLRAIQADPAALEHFRQRAFEADLKGLTLDLWIDELLDFLSESADLHLATRDAIELTTSFSAKGLEWDLVIPLGLGRRIYPGETTGYPRIFGSEQDQVVAWTAESPRAQSWQETEDQVLARYRRLLYVTLTRARHALILPDISYQDSTRSFLQAANFDLAEVPVVETPLTSPHRMAKAFEAATITMDELAPDALHLASLESRKIPKLILPHALAKDTDAALPDEEFEPIARAYEYGRVWHDWVQNFPWTATPESRTEYARSVQRMFSERGKAEIDLFLQSEALQEIFGGAEWIKPEVSFSYPQSAGEWIEGIIDLLVGTRRGDLWIIDWKTNQKRANETDQKFSERLLKQYLPQLASYRAVIEEGFDRKVSRLLLYSTMLGRFCQESL